MSGMYRLHNRFQPAARVLSALLSFCLLFSGVPVASAAAGGMAVLPEPGTMVRLSAPYEPAVIRGITVYPDNPLKFDFIIDRGQDLSADEPREAEYGKLVKYFLAALTVPEEDLWVNLSPYEESRMIPEVFSRTEMGRDLLAQDYLLKQLTASLMYPEEELGERFWTRVYQKAQQMYGTTDIPVNTFNKVWIVPERATVFERGSSAFVAESRLKVLMEADYRARSGATQASAPSDEVAEEVIREVVIPEIEREVNEGEHFVQLRQMYDALILATWYKRSLREGLLGQVYVDQNKVSGVDIADKEEKTRIYQQYLAAFRKGVYNYIKEDYDPAQQSTVVRQYFSGGAGLQLEQSGAFQSTADYAQLSRLGRRNISALLDTDPQSLVGRLDNVVVNLREVMPDAAVMAVDQWADDARIDVIRGGRSGHINDAEELISITDLEGNVIGSIPKSVAHEQGVPHMAVNLYLYDSRGRILFQRRSNHKKEAVGKLQVSVSGHVDKGETAWTAVLRETEEELGIVLNPERLARVTKVNEIFREEILPDAVIRKFVTVYAYRVTDEELDEIKAGYNLNEVSELWLIPPALFEAILARHPENFSRSLLNIVSDTAHAVYDRLRARMPDFAVLVEPVSEETAAVQTNAQTDQALILTAEQISRRDEIIARGYLGFDALDWTNLPVWMRNLLEYFQATDMDAYHDLMAKVQAGFVRAGEDEKDMIDGFQTNHLYIVATNRHQHPEITMLKLLDPDEERNLLNAYIKWTARDNAIGNLIGFTAGVIATSVRAFASEGIFDLFDEGRHSPTMAEIEQHLRARGKNANKGYLHGVLYTFAKLGWLTRSGRQADDAMSFTLTEKGRGVLGAVAAYAQAADFDRIALKLSRYLRDDSPRETTEVFNKIIGRLATLSSRHWDLPRDMDPELRREVQQHLDGFIVGPLLTVMRERELNIAPDLLTQAGIDMRDYAPNELSLGRFRAAFGILRSVGFVDVQGTKVRLTKKGEANFRRTLNYGVPVSYYPTYALAEEFLFGNPESVARYTPDGIETLVDRILNTDGSDKSHEGYFKKVKAEFGVIMETMFAQNRIPSPEEMERRVAAGDQPFTFMISDVGAGKGGFLLNMYDVVMNSDFGELMRDYPDLYRVVLVGIDFNRAARDNMSANFQTQGIPHIILDGDIGKPQEILATMRSKFNEMKIRPDIMFNIRSMLDHNRQWAQVSDTAAAEAREPISTSVFAYRGQLIPNKYVEQNLKEHFAGWAELADELLIIELHTLDEDTVAGNLTSTLDVPYYLSHLLSDQYIVERPVFMAMAEEAGYEVKTLATYPSEEMATVGIYHFSKRNASDKAMTAEANGQPVFTEHLTASGRPMLWRTKPVEVGEVIEMLSSGDKHLQDMIRHARYAMRNNLHLDEIDMVGLPEYDGHDVEVAVLGSQPTNSFKPWIAYGILQEASVNPDLKKIITSTTGNQGIAVAWVARTLSAYYGRKFEAVIYVGKNTPREKLEEMSRLGATIIGDPREEAMFENYDEAFSAAEAEADRLGDEGYYVYHADTSAIISYAALGEAIVERFVADGYDLDKSAIFVPVGAGGLASGVAIAAKLRNRRTKVILVQTERTRHAFDSLKEGEMKNYVDEYRDKLDEDGIDTKSMEPLAFEVLHRLADGLVMVDSSKIQEKIGFKKVHGIKAEGAAVLPYIAMEEISADLRDVGVRHILNVGTGSNISDVEVTVATLLSPEGRLHTAGLARDYARDEVVTPGNVMLFRDTVSREDVDALRALSSPIAGTEPVSEDVVREEGKILLAAKVSAFFGDPSQKLSFGHQLPLSIYMNQKISYVNDDWQDYIGNGPVSVLGVITRSYRNPKLPGKAEVTVRTMVVAEGGELLLDGESRLLVNAPEQYDNLPERPHIQFDKDEAEYRRTMLSREMVITEELLEEMSRVSGDYNPVHQAADPDIADQYGIFKQRIAHGLLGAALITGYARGGRLLEGVYLDEQDFTFLKAVNIGDRVRVRLKVDETGEMDGRRVRKLASELEKWNGEKWERAIMGSTRLLSHQVESDQSMLGEGKTAVVVDDYASLARGLSLLLKTRGFDTRMALNAEDALALVEQLEEAGAKVDLIVTDKDMPGMSGIDLVERIHDRFPHIRMIMQTGDVEGIKLISERLGIPVESKPLTMAVLEARIRDVFADEALTAEEQVGGIDLNPAGLDLQIRRDPAGIPLPVNLQPLDTINIEGFVPVIIEITPVYTLPMLLGVAESVPPRDSAALRPDDPWPRPENTRDRLARSQNL